MPKMPATVSPEPKLVEPNAKARADGLMVLPLFVQWPPLPVGGKQAGKGETWMVGRGTKPKFSGFGEVQYDVCWDVYVGRFYITHGDYGKGFAVHKTEDGFKELGRIESLVTDDGGSTVYCWVFPNDSEGKDNRANIALKVLEELEVIDVSGGGAAAKGSEKLLKVQQEKQTLEQKLVRLGLVYENKLRDLKVQCYDLSKEGADTTDVDAEMAKLMAEYEEEDDQLQQQLKLYEAMDEMSEEQAELHFERMALDKREDARLLRKERQRRETADGGGGAAAAAPSADSGAAAAAGSTTTTRCGRESKPVDRDINDLISDAAAARRTQEKAGLKPGFVLECATTTDSQDTQPESLQTNASEAAFQEQRLNAQQGGGGGAAAASASGSETEGEGEEQYTSEGGTEYMKYPPNHGEDYNELVLKAEYDDDGAEEPAVKAHLYPDGKVVPADAADAAAPATAPVQQEVAPAAPAPALKRNLSHGAAQGDGKKAATASSQDDPTDSQVGEALAEYNAAGAKFPR
jgi:hypothetical protein